MDFKKLLSNWYLENKRDLPWRNTNNPYHIWVSEIILQQTRVAQGISYYYRFVETFPTVYDLAQADEDQVLKVWQGLGYYSRARNMHFAAKTIIDHWGGKIPSNYSDLLKIKGIGDYSAGAIASFAYKEAVPAIDGNVYRVMARVFGVFSSPQTASGKREFNNLVSDLLDKNKPDQFNQGLLDFGALQCIPRNPKCENCPFNAYCYAFRNNVVDSLPVKAKKIEQRDRYFTYLLLRYGNYSFIAKRMGKDIWQSLYEFPLIETDCLLELSQITINAEWIRLLGGTKTTITYFSPVVKHLLSHQNIYTRFVIVELDSIPKTISEKYIKMPTAEIDNYSVPRVIDSFLAAEPASKYFLNPPQ
jgi:A/G-specific adenine glycosylase